MFLALLTLCMICGFAVAGSYGLVRAPAPGIYTNHVGGVGNVVQIEVYDSAVASGTVVLYKSVPGSASSNLEYTATCANGTAVAALSSTNTFYLAGGDVLTRVGTATNGTVRLILE